MADLTVNIVGDAANTADKIRGALGAMGEAGEQAASKVSYAGAGLSSAMAPAQAAAQKTQEVYQSMFQRIAAAGAGSGATGLAAVVAEANRAQQAFEQLQEFSTSMAQIGDAGSAGMARMADKSQAAAVAIQEVVTKMGTMLAAGEDVNTVIAMLTTRLAEIGSATNFTGKLQTEFSGLREEFALASDAVSPISERIRIASQAIEQFTNQARTSALATVNSLKGIADAEDNIAIRAKTATATLGGATSFLTNIAMGTQMLSQGGVMGSLMGVQQLTSAMREGSAGGAQFIAIAGAMVPVIAAVAAAALAAKMGFDALREAMKNAGEQETLDIRLKGIIGSASQTQEAISRINAASTGSVSFIPIEQLKEGVAILEQFSGAALTTEPALRAIGAASAASGVGFTQLAEQVGRVYMLLQTGAPIRQGLLTSLVNEQALTVSDTVQIKNLATAHADASTKVQALTNDLLKNQTTADLSKNSWQGLLTALSNVFTVEIANPIGDALIQAFKVPLQEFTDFLKDSSGGIKQFADTLEFDLLTAFYLVRDVGINEAWKDAIQGMGKLISDNWVPILQNVATTAFDNWKTSAMGFLDWFDTQLRNILGNIGKGIQSLLSTPMTVTLQNAVDNAQNKLNSDQLAARYDLVDQDLKVLNAAQDALAASQKATTTDIGGKQIDLLGQIRTIMENLPTSIGSAFKSLSVGTLPSGLPYAGGTLRTTAFGYPGDLTPDAGSSQGRGTYSPGLYSMQTGAVAMNPQTGAQLGMQPMQQAIATFTDALGNVTRQLVYWADTGPKPGVIDRYMPGISAAQGNSYSGTTTLQPIPGQFGPGGVTPLQSQSMTAVDRAEEEARARIGASPLGPSTAPKLGTGDEQLIKANNADMKALDETIKQIGIDEKTYTDNVSFNDKEVKAGYMTAQTANQQQVAGLKTLISQEETEISHLNDIANLVRNDQTAPQIAKAKDELQKLNPLLQEHQQLLKQIDPANYWQSFVAGINQAISAWGTLNTQMQAAGKQMTDALESGIVSGLTELVSGTKSASQAFKDMATSIINSIEQIILKMLVQQAIQAAMGAFGHASQGGYVTAAPVGTSGYIGAARGGLIREFPTGGVVTGGTAGSDSVPAMLTPGEYVLTTAQVNSMGTRALDAWRMGSFAGGGMVGGPGPTFGTENMTNAMSGIGSPQGGEGFATGGLVRYYASGGSVNQGVPQAGTFQAFNQGHQINTTVTMPSGGGTGGMSPKEAKQFQDSMVAAIKWEIARQQKPGGLLNRNMQG